MSQTGLAFFLVFIAGTLAALFIRPAYGLYLYIGVFYADPPSRWWGAGLPQIRWSLVAAIFTLLAILVNQNRSARKNTWIESGIAKVLMLYVAWMWLQWPWVVSPHHLTGTILYTKYLMLFYLMYTLIETEDDFEKFCLAHVLGCAYLGWLIFLSPNTGRLEDVGGAGIGNANTLGMHLGTGIIFAGFLLLTLKGWKRWCTLAVIPFIVNGLFQTQTRGAFVGILLGGIVAIYLKPKSIRKRFYALAIAGIFGGILFANEALIERLSTMEAAYDSSRSWDNSAESRLATAAAQVRMFIDHPLGAGHQGTAFLSPGYIEQKYLDNRVMGRASHNTVMTILVDQGIPGIVLFAVLVVMIFKMLHRLKSYDKVGLPRRLAVFRAMIGSTLACIFGAGMFAQYFKAEVLIWTLALLAILWRICNEFQFEDAPVTELERGMKQLKSSNA